MKRKLISLLLGLTLVLSCAVTGFAADAGALGDAPELGALPVPDWNDSTMSLDEFRQAALDYLKSIDTDEIADDPIKKRAVEMAIELTERDIERAQRIEEIKTTVDEAKSLFQEIKNDINEANAVIKKYEEEKEKERQEELEADARLEAAKKKANEELDAEDPEKNPDRYIEPEKTVVSKAVMKGRGDISSAATPEDVSEAVAAAMAVIDKQPLYDSSLPNPAAKKASAAKNRKALTAKWKKLSASKRKMITGFQVQTDTNKSFRTKPKLVTVKGASKTCRKIKKLKKGRYYYVRVRSYAAETDPSTGKAVIRRVGSWSKTKKVKLK